MHVDICIHTECPKNNAFLNWLPFFWFYVYKIVFIIFLIYYHSGLLLCNQFLSSVAIDRIPIETRVFVVKTFYQFNESDAETMRLLCISLGWDAAPDVSSICWLIKKSKKTGPWLGIKVSS